MCLTGQPAKGHVDSLLSSMQSKQGLCIVPTGHMYFSLPMSAFLAKFELMADRGCEI